MVTLLATEAQRGVTYGLGRVQQHLANWMKDPERQLGESGDVGRAEPEQAELSVGAERLA